MTLNTARKVLQTELDALKRLLERLDAALFLSSRAQRGTCL